MRPDLVHLMSWQISCASYDNFLSEQFRSASFLAGLKSMQSPVVGSTVKHEMVFKPLANAFTFGLFSKFTISKETTV